MSSLRVIGLVAGTGALLGLASCSSRQPVAGENGGGALLVKSTTTSDTHSSSIRDSFVSITIRGSEIKPNLLTGDTEGLRTRFGVVVHDGMVLTTLGAVQGAEWVEVVDASGHRSVANGVAGYLSEANIVLLDVAWSHERLPSASIASVSPPKDAMIQCVIAGSNEERECQVAECRTPTTMYAKWPSVPAQNTPKVVATSEGQLLGIATGAYTGFRVNGADVKCDLSNVVYVVRPEVLRAIKRYPTVPWSEWAGRLASIDRSQETTQSVMKSIADRSNDLVESVVESLMLATNDDPLNAQAWRAIANLAARSRKIDIAESAARKALDLVPTDPVANYVLAGVLLRKDDFAGALDTIDAAIAEKDDDAEYFHIRGYALARLDRTEEAIRAMRLAVLLKPTDKGMKKFLERLEQIQGETDGTKPAPNPQSDKVKF